MRAAASTVLAGAKAQTVIKIVIIIIFECAKAKGGLGILLESVLFYRKNLRC